MRTRRCFNRDCNGACFTPSVPQSAINSLYRNCIKFCPCTRALPNSVNCYPAVSPHISHLLFLCSPTHITNFIVSVVIGIAVKGVFRGWLSSHVFQKLRKRKKSEFNTAPTIIPVLRIFRILTTAFSSYVCLIFPRNVIHDGLAMDGKAAARGFRFQASTRLRNASEQILPSDIANISTLTQTLPRTLFVDVSPYIFLNSPPRKYACRQINKAMMGWKRYRSDGRFVVGHRFSFVETVISLAKEVDTFWRAVSILPQSGVQIYG